VIAGKNIPKIFFSLRNNEQLRQSPIELIIFRPTMKCMHSNVPLNGVVENHKLFFMDARKTFILMLPFASEKNH
jgi:hypothetical protein